jgi:hypothetical protein
LERIDIKGGFLGRLTAHELAQEQQLMARVGDFFWSARARNGMPERLLGGFENSWTVAPRDLRVAG